MFQQKLAKKIANYQRKISDIHIEHLGTEQTLIRMEITEDKYGDRNFSITSHEKIVGILQYPGAEIPITFGESNTDSTSKNIHLYDLLPIELYVKNTTQLKHGDILYQKLRVDVNLPITDPNAFRLLALQVIDKSTKFTTEVVWTKYEVAPYTLNYDTDAMTQLETIIDTYLGEEW